ncbi:hypothetical protein CTI12_AA589610 [Artemisia annua]|uniref:Uncharacterized protein n=1 Tax=Artemisia annua TaxID=35608 RepID=A0A2U1KL80_ARTAN|nr:hypothetical protein CTI12_AA589610 [Artemisia annua]
MSTSIPTTNEAVAMPHVDVDGLVARNKNGKKVSNTESSTNDDVASVVDSAIDANLVKPVSQGTMSKDGEGVANAVPKDTNHDANTPDG